jgi:hypothetical protein
MEQEYILFMGGDLNGFQYIRNGYGTTLYGHDLHTIRCYLTQETRIYGLEVGISTVFEIFGHFLYQVGTGQLHMIMTYITLDATSHKKQEYIWFRGGDSNGF